MKKDKKKKWRSGKYGAGIIPYIYIDGVLNIFLGKRKKGIDLCGLLSLPHGFIDLPKNKKIANNPEWTLCNREKGYFHNPVETAIRETWEEALLHLDRSKIEPLIWNQVGYSIKLKSFFQSTLYPYLLSTEEARIMEGADTLEMNEWTPYSERTIHLLEFNGELALPQEYEAMKLLFAKLRLDRNT